jgi:hypothetical protein
MPKRLLSPVILAAAVAAARSPAHGAAADADTAAATLVFSGTVARRMPQAASPAGGAGAACDRVAFRPDYVWRGPAADTLVVVVTDSAAFGAMRPGVSFVIRGERAPRTGPADSCAGRWTTGADGWQETELAYLTFHELGHPAWVRPGRPWLDLTAEDLLTIARAHDDAPAATTALRELRRELNPTAYAARLVAAWQSASAALRQGILAVVRDASAPLDTETRRRLHGAVLDTCADPVAGQRRLAVDVLGDLGVRSTVTVLVLEKLRDTDPDPGVRRGAAAALVRLAALDG